MGSMLLIWSILVGSLGVEAIAVGTYLRWWQITVDKEHEEEEEILTRYQSKENMQMEQMQDMISSQGLPNGNAALQLLKESRAMGWEFKIVRASGDLFQDPMVFKRLCDEESQAGWVLLEKLDNRRVRFKRPIALREMIKQELLAFDPYRSHYGPSSNIWSWLGAIALVGFTVLPAYLGYVLVSTTLINSNKQADAISPPAQTTLPALNAPTFPPK